MTMYYQSLIVMKEKLSLNMSQVSMTVSLKKNYESARLEDQGLENQVQGLVSFA